jgi:hypothetical protein
MQLTTTDELPVRKSLTACAVHLSYLLTCRALQSRVSNELVNVFADSGLLRSHFLNKCQLIGVDFFERLPCGSTVSTPALVLR